MFRTTIIKTARPVMFATLIAASGIGIAPFVIDAPAMARGGGNGGGGGGADGGAGGGGGGGANADVYAVIAQSRNVPGSTVPPRGRVVAEHPEICGATRGVRVVYDMYGDPLRYSCMIQR